MIPDDLLLGASPDALLLYPDGTVEVLEVKNHCPFVPNNYSSFKNRKTKDESKPPEDAKQAKHLYRIRTWDTPTTIQNAYVPQLMMEMACVGPHCASAVMVRVTAEQYIE
jgi:hypothetical protein